MTSAARPVSQEAPPRVELFALCPVVPEDPAVRVAFTGRAAGNLSLLVGEGDIATSRSAALAAVAAQSSDAVFMQQVHGGAVARVDRTSAGSGVTDHDDAMAGVDALVTSADGVALAVLTADCVPVLLINPGRAVAAVHAGRGGVLGDVVPNALTELAGDDASAVVALVGPAIGGCCYEVPPDLAATVTATHPAAAATTTWGTPALDLPAAVVAQLHAAGVARIETMGGCTRCNDDVWFSHRSATAGATAPGRQAGIVVRNPAGAPEPTATTPSLQSP